MDNDQIISALELLAGVESLYGPGKDRTALMAVFCDVFTKAAQEEKTDVLEYIVSQIPEAKRDELYSQTFLLAAKDTNTRMLNWVNAQDMSLGARDRMYMQAFREAVADKNLMALEFISQQQQNSTERERMYAHAFKRANLDRNTEMRDWVWQQHISLETRNIIWHDAFVNAAEKTKSRSTIRWLTERESRITSATRASAYSQALQRVLIEENTALRDLIGRRIKAFEGGDQIISKIMQSIPIKASDDMATSDWLWDQVVSADVRRGILSRKFSEAITKGEMYGAKWVYDNTSPVEKAGLIEQAEKSNSVELRNWVAVQKAKIAHEARRVTTRKAKDAVHDERAVPATKRKV